MTKILVVGDIHIMDTPPRSRKDDYATAIINKLLWVAKYANTKKNKIDAVVWSGDVFHYPQPNKTSHGLVSRMIEVVKAHKVPLYTIWGNHDSRNPKSDDLSKKPLNILLQAGLMHLSGWDATLPIYGVDWQNDWDDPNTVEQAFAGYKEEGGSDTLAITHCPIYPPEQQDSQMFELVPTHGAHSLSEAMGNRGNLYYGHIHEHHGVFEDDGVTYCNVGALGRESLQPYNLTREIKVAVWDSETGFSEVDVPFAPASEVFYVEEIAEEKKEKKSLDDYLESVGSSVISVSDKDSVVSYVKAADIAPRVKRKAIEILEEV